MPRILLSIALRLLACALLIYPVWLWLGITSVVLTSPLVAGALARPLIDLAGELRHLVRELVHRPGPDEHYAFLSTRIAVRTDDDGLRWLRLAHLRDIVPGLAGERVLSRVFPDGCRRFEPGGEPYLLDRCAVELLGRANASDDTAVRLRNWIRREVSHPAQRLRERRGLPEPAGLQDQAFDEAPDHMPDQAPDQAPDQSPDQAPNAAPVSRPS